MLQMDGARGESALKCSLFVPERQWPAVPTPIESIER